MPRQLELVVPFFRRGDPGKGSCYLERWSRVPQLNASLYLEEENVTWDQQPAQLFGGPIHCEVESRLSGTTLFLTSNLLTCVNYILFVLL